MSSSDVRGAWGPRPAGPEEPLSSSGCGCGTSGCLAVAGLLAGAFMLLLFMAALLSGGGVAMMALLPVVAVGSVLFLLSREGSPGSRKRVREKPLHDFILSEEDSLLALREYLEDSRKSVHLGEAGQTHTIDFADSQQSVVILGPPRSGKTRGIVIPTVLSSPGAVVSTSTKRDVYDATAQFRSRLGKVWVFDPTGSEGDLPEATSVRWSPVARCHSWDRSRLMATAMIDASDSSQGVENASYWRQQAKILLAPLLHAAALAGGSIIDVRAWLARGEFSAASQSLEVAKSQMAMDDLHGINTLGDRERGSIVATARVALDAYSSESVQRTCRDQNFDAFEFVKSKDVLYIISPSHQQAICAPLISGLLEELTWASYREARMSSEPLWPPVVWALDEISNIAPIRSLPNLLSEGGGQGVQILACFQDLSQARVKWGTAAEGFLTLFNVKVVFPGIGDQVTLQTLSTQAGEWDRPYRSASTSRSSSKEDFRSAVSRTDGSNYTVEHRREAMLPPAEIATIPKGFILRMTAEGWSLNRAPSYSNSKFWRGLIEKFEVVSTVEETHPSSVDDVRGYTGDDEPEVGEDHR